MFLVFYTAEQTRSIKQAKALRTVSRVFKWWPHECSEQSPSCPWTKEWTKKMCAFTHWSTTQQKSNKDILKFAGKWVDLENITLSEMTQTQKYK